jgi:hypothetical protein
MADLQDVQLWRAGVTSNYLHKENRSVDASGYPKGIRNGGPCLTITHNLSSKGGGTTSVVVDIGIGSFAEVVFAMMAADREATLRAFGTVLSGPSTT